MIGKFNTLQYLLAVQTKGDSYEKYYDNIKSNDR